jgi:pentatricopeptide repeat protein
MFTSIATEFLQSIAFELGIFAVTLVLAMLFQGVPFGRQKKMLKLPQAKAMQTEKLKASGRAGSPDNRRPVKEPSSQILSSELSEKIASMVDCAKARRSADAIAMYTKMKATGEHAAIKHVAQGCTRYSARMCKERPMDVFGLLVQCAGSVGRHELIEVFLDDMATLGIEKTIGFYESTMRLLASKKLYKEAISVCSRLEADGLEPSTVTLSCLINFAAEIGDSDRAVEFFNRLAATSTPSIRAYMTVLRVYSRRPDWPKSLAALRDMQQRQVAIDSLVLNVVLATGVASGNLAGAQALVKEFSDIEIADVVSYNTVLKGLAQQKETDEALKLLDEMCESGVQPNAITFNTAMDAAIRNSRIADAWCVLKRMRSSGLAPDKFTCTTLVKGLQAGATSQQLTEILDLMQNAGCPFTDSSSDCTLRQKCLMLWRSVIEATVQINDPVLFARAISQMRQQKITLPAQEYQRQLQVLMRGAPDASMQGAPWREQRTSCGADCQPVASERMRPVGVC